jgi:murein DD-endopeptidase MepM/ murein hydrolase activator NlpD
VLHFERWQLLLGALLAALVLMLTSGAVYHYFFLQAAREGWPVVSQLVRWVVRDDLAQRERYMRENLDAMAQRVGQMHAKLIKLEAMGERLSSLASVKVEEIKPLPRAKAGGSGGPFIPVPPTLDELNGLVASLDESAEQHTDLFTLVESRLLEARLKALMVPNQRPVDGDVGSGFGFRSDPLTGRAALHTGLDFPADIGTAIHAAAGGVVVASDWHPAYGQVVEIDHGNGLLTRYAHCSKVLVAAGALVRRGQRIAEVGNSGRSTGPHLHFEVLLDGVPQDPARFLAGGARATMNAVARGGR